MEVVNWGSEWEMREIEGNKVVKLFPAGTPRDKVDHEVTTTLLARQYGLEAPFVHGAVEEGGRLGIVFDKVIGPSFTQWMAEHPTWQRKLTEFFAHEHHEVHMHRVPELPRLKDILSERISRKEGYGADERERLLRKLARMPDGDWVCHMNYVPDNIMVSIDGPIAFHWGGAVRGDYLADVARTALLLERWDPKVEHPEINDKIRDMFARGYVVEYIKICGRMDEELDDWKELLRAAAP